MERTMTIKKFFAPSTTRLGRQQWFRNVWQRLTMVLMLVILTTATAWAQETTMTVTAENVTVTYDGSEHYITVNVSVPESGATITYCETENGTYTDTNPTYTNAGVNTVYYKVTASGYADYSGSATVTINKAPLTITANSKSINYGDEPANNGVTYSGFVNGENENNLVGTLTYAYSYSQYGDVGNAYAITPSGLTSSNYEISFVDGTLTVIAKALTVTADDITIDHGAAAPAYTYTVTGLVNGESLTTEPALSCDYAQGDGIGTYPISISGAAASANYTISYTPGTLTVQSKKYTVTFQNEDGTQLQSSEVEWGETPAYTGETPTKAATAQYIYTFAGWMPEIVAVSEDATYTATYSSTLRTNGYCGTDDPKTTDVDESETVTWNYDTDTKTITIAGSGPMMYYNSVQNGENWNNGAPWRAFAGEIEHVVISDGITYVGSNTFAHCPNISSVTLPTDQHLYEIGPGAFGDCTSLTSIDIPMSVNKINDGAFAGCSNLASVTLGYGNGAKFTIGKEVFPATTTIIVPLAGLLSYLGADGWSAYADKVMSTGYCGKKIYNSEPPYEPLADYTTNLIWTLRAITKTTDQGLTLEKVTVNDNQVAALKLTVSANTVNPVNTQAKGAFDMADGQYDDNNTCFIFPWSTGSDEHVLAIRDVVIEDGVTSIGSSAFRFPISGKITNATIGKDVKTIDSEAFHGTNLANVTFAENSTLEKIGYKAFKNTSLTNITIPASVKTIGGYAFQYCGQLATVTFEDSSEKPSQLTSIGDYAFERTKITTITLPKSVTDIYNAFRGCTTLQTVNFAADATIEAIGYGAFLGCTSLQSITIPASVTLIENDVFLNCTSLSAVNFVEGSALKTVLASAFDGCTKLTETNYVLNLPTTVTDVFSPRPSHLVSCLAAKLWSNVTEKLSYSGKCGVEDLDYETETVKNSPDNVQFTMRSNGTLSDNSPALRMNIYKNTENPIGTDFSIADCSDAESTRWADVRTNLTAVVIEDGVEGIGNNAFGGCVALKTFRVKPTTAPVLGTNVFDGCTALTIIAPASYKTADGWKSEGIVEKLRADREDLFTGGTEWMTWCNDLDWSAPAGCNVYVVSGVGENTVTLTALTETANADRTEGEENAEGIRIPAYTPVILQKTVANATGLQARFAKVGTVPTSGYNTSTGLVTKDETGFSMLGAATDATITEGGFTEQPFYSLYNGKFYRYEGTQAIAAHRCILTVSPVYTAPVLTIGTETTSLSPVPSPSREGSSQGWYTLDGRKLNGKPTQKGIYVNGGRKVVIK